MSGIKHDSDKSDWSILPFNALEGVVKVFMFGAKKYERHNYRGGFKQSRLLSAILRHITSHIRGETLDPETGEMHLAHAVCGLLMLISNIKDGVDDDDRYVDNVTPADPHQVIHKKIEGNIDLNKPVSKEEQEWSEIVNEQYIDQEISRSTLANIGGLIPTRYTNEEEFKVGDNLKIYSNGDSMEVYKIVHVGEDMLRIENDGIGYNITKSEVRKVVIKKEEPEDKLIIGDEVSYCDSYNNECVGEVVSVLENDIYAVFDSVNGRTFNISGHYLEVVK